MKRRMLALLSAAVMIVSMSAVPAAAEEAKEVKTLSLLMYTDWYKDGWKALEQYISENKETLGFDLEISTIQGGSEGDQIIATKFASDDLPDLIEVYKPIWMNAHCGGCDKLVDLSDLNCVSEYSDDLLHQIYYDGDKLCGLPIDTVNYMGCWWYNKELLEEYDIAVPQTWDEFLAACEFFKTETDIIPVYYSGADVWTLQVNDTGMFSDAIEAGLSISELMEKINTNQMKYADCKHLEKSIADFKSLIDLGYVQDSYLSDTFDNAQDAIVNKEAAFYNNATYFIDNVVSKYPEEADKIGAFFLPLETGESFVDMLTAYTICVTTQAEDVEAAKAAVDFICSSEAQQIYANAQPGVYMNNNITFELPLATQSIYDKTKEDMVFSDWLESNLYSYGNLGTYVADLYVGTYTEPMQILEEMDAETARNAEAAGDPNWE